MAFVQGAVVISDDQFNGAGKRPYVIISNSSNPFHGQQYIAVPMTTRAPDSGIEVPEREWVRDSPDKTPCHVSPWSPVTLQAEKIYQSVGEVSDKIIERIYAHTIQYMSPDTVVGQKKPA